jgi:tetratricopeptide (TPR) repeat protein
LLVVVAYLPALRAGFIWDDDAYVTQNPLLTNPGGWREIWFSAHTQSQYFPLVYTTFRAEHALWGFHPLGFHLVNVVLHGCVAVLVWQVLRRLSVPGAWLAAAIFALHPVQVETVAWVTELKNIESLLFYLLAVLAWMKFDESPAPRCWRFYGLALAAYLLALFAKTTACTLPAALVLVLWLRGKRFAWSRALAILPFVLIGLAMGAVTIWWEGHLDNFNQDFDVSLNPLQRLLLAGRALWFYAGKLAWPMGLTFSYPHWDINPAELWQYVPLAGCLAVAALAWVWRKKIGRGPLAGLVFFVAALSPLLGFLMEYTFRYSFVADHYQYGASIGLIAVAAAILVSQLAKTGLLPAVQAALLLLLGCLTWHQAGAYQNLETLWGDTVSKNPGSWMAQHNLASELFAQGRQDEAFPHFQAAVALHPGGDVEQADLGLALMEKGLDAEALPHFEAALAVNPHLFAAQNNLALACADLGNLDQAVAHFKLALQLNTNSPGTLLNLGDVFQRQNRLDDAVQCYRQLTAQFPADVEPWRRLMAALLAAGRSGDALAAGQQGLAGTGHNVALLSDLGNAWFAQTNYDAAAGCFRGALKAAPASAELHFNLAVILGLQGHEAAEREELQTVLRLKPDFSAARQKLLSLPAPQGK